MQIRNTKLETGLYVVATPIGNARDITLRALDVLMAADLVLCEDTRITSKLFSLHGLNTPLLAYHEHNGEKVRPKILSRLAEGQVIALVSDAGTPLISDPGYQLVSAVQAQGHEVISVPGPSSPIAALSIAGMPSDRFLFAGFLSSKSKARQNSLSELAELAATLVLFESARRLPALLADIVTVLGDRDVAICRELTKKFEEVRRGGAVALAAYYDENGPPKGELVVLIKGRSAQDLLWDRAAVVEALTDQLGSAGTRTASDTVAELSGWRRRTVYQLALELLADKSEAQDGSGT